MENNEEVFLIIFIGYLKFKSQFYGLNKKIRNALKNDIKFDEIVKLTIKLNSSISFLEVSRLDKKKSFIKIIPFI